MTILETMMRKETDKALRFNEGKPEPELCDCGKMLPHDHHR